MLFSSDDQIMILITWHRIVLIKDHVYISIKKNSFLTCQFSCAPEVHDSQIKYKPKFESVTGAMWECHQDGFR